MLQWLKTKIRNWLLDDGKEETPKPVLECIVNDKLVTYRITGANGFLLWGITPDGPRLVGPGVACDRDHYQKLLDYYHKDLNISWKED